MADNRRVAVLVGSLRRESLNRRLALALAALAPPALQLGIVEIGELPPFNQDNWNIIALAMPVNVAFAAVFWLDERRQKQLAVKPSGA